MEKVLIVREGQWGSVEKETYEVFIQTVQEAIQEVETTRHGEKEKAAEVVLVESAEMAKVMIKTREIAAVVFISRGMELQAERLAQKYPRTRVVVFTGLIPEGKVRWIDKGWIPSKRDIARFVLH